MIGYHQLVVDLFPPTRRAPDGIHGAIWAEIDEATCAAPPDRPLKTTYDGAWQGMPQRWRRDLEG